ncbi:ParA family protein [Paenibacillus zeisoli]|uniref:ParA family protein n=1 Tax=Paenibacillus zeisoli TaxID=2496267 RepID=A0A433X2T6_9BACL|nr:AAA family ATPase [Paenibacillus zeisoli]RUT28376.1 ParA family protein [Paenibacillus zeisoli]
MVPVRIVLAVQDEFYIEALMHYVRCSEFSQKIRVTAFSKVEAFVKRMMDAGEVPDAVVADSMYLEAWTPPAGEREILRISLIEGERDRQEGVVVLHKYQPLKELLTSILTAVQGQRKPLATPSGSTSVIAVYSVSGGSGKSTTALQLSRQLSSEGLEVLYLNLESAGSGLSEASGRQEQDMSGLARLLYDLQAAEDKGERLALSAADYVIRQPALQVAMFEPLSNLNELLELSREHTMRLIDCLVSSGIYDYIVLDTDSYPSERTEGILERCDQLIWLILDDIGSVHRTDRWLAHLERTRGDLYTALIQKSIFTVNRYLGNLVNQLPLEKVVPYLTLPYIPAWKQLDSWEVLFRSPEYQRDLMKLCSQIMEVSGSRTDPVLGGEWK